MMYRFKKFKTQISTHFQINILFVSYGDNGTDSVETVMAKMHGTMGSHIRVYHSNRNHTLPSACIIYGRKIQLTNSGG